MNDRHPAGTATPPAVPQEAAPAFGAYDQGAQHDGYGGYDGYGTGSYATTTDYATDPLFGDLTASTGSTGYDTGSYDTGSYDIGAAGATGAYGTGTTGSYDTGGYDTGSYDTGQWNGSTTTWAPTGGDGDTGTHTSLDYAAYAAQQPYGSGDTGSYTTTGTWDVPAYPGTPLPDAGDTGQWETQQFAGDTYDTRTFDPQDFAVGPVSDADTGAFDATAWNTDGASAPYDAPYGEPSPYEEPVERSAPVTFDQQETICAGIDTYALLAEADATTVLPELPELTDPTGSVEPAGDPSAPGGPGGPPPANGADGVRLDIEPVVLSRRAPAPGGRGRARRRTPAKRSALLTVAVPSACVMGVAGIAAGAVTMTGDADGKDETKTTAAPEVTPVKPSVANSKLDTQIAGLSADAGDFADRASRTQERIDLKARQEADRKRAAAAAERKERLRPKFALPVKRNGLSAYYGQAGINWMSLHTGIDFPVGYGTPVMAATDGTVRTQINSAYGNMVIVTAKDGTETWYCHLSRYTVMSGPVKAGDVIAYSGDSGNSTGPHLHFEVRPGGGSPVDPLSWFRSHGLDPT
ncbi:M23 family metallopeptidase [Streptomyces sp. JNUCC 64]